MTAAAVRDSAHCLESLHEWKERPRLHELGDIVTEALDPLARLLDCTSILDKDAPLGLVLELLFADPRHILLGPGSLALVVAPTVPKEEVLELAPNDVLRFLGVAPRSYQIPHRLADLVGNVDRCEISEALEAGELHGVTAIGLDALALLFRDE